MSEKFSSKEETIGKLLKNYRFEVPKYQRYYSWREESNIYLEDVLGAIEKGEEYFIGPMILSSDDRNEYKVIDGQQRLITTAIIISVIRDIYAKKGFTESASLIYNGYLIEKEVYSSGNLRLTPSRIDKDFFESLIKNEADIDEKKKIAKGKIKEKKFESWKNIWSFYEDCYKHILDKLNSTPDNPEIFLNKIIESLDKDIKVIVIEVKNDSDAYLIFETLNDRGLQLSMADLLKNYLFSKLEDERLIDEYELRWSYFLEEIGASKLVQFIRYYWIAREDFTREKDLFRKIKAKIDTINKAKVLIDELCCVA